MIHDWRNIIWDDLSSVSVFDMQTATIAWDARRIVQIIMF